MKPQHLFVVLWLFISSTAKSQIITDGTLGPTRSLPGPNYQIGADLGQQHGGNLFHSFQDFNLNSAESATFSGPSNVQNILSRVTGGNSSNLDGLIRSTIPNANFYFLNPYGIVFGPHAQLDIPGSFHASTADYLRQGDGGRFDARNPSDSILTVAPIESFGFLAAPAPISVRGHGPVVEDWEGGLRVPAGKMISLIGGEITMTGTFFEKPAENESYGMDITRFPLLKASAGQINLAGVASAGEVTMGEGFLDVASVTDLADITIEDRSRLETSGEGGGSIFIRGGDIVLRHSQLISTTLGAQDGGVISLWGRNIFTEGYPDAYSNEYRLNQPMIETATISKGHGGDIDMRATHDIVAKTNSLFDAEAGYFTEALRWQSVEGLGGGGDVRFEAENITLDKGSRILMRSSGKDNYSGSLTLQATDSIHLSFATLSLGNSFLTRVKEDSPSSNAFLQAKNIDFDYSFLGSYNFLGDITIQAEQLSLDDSGIVRNSRLAGVQIMLDVGELLVTNGSYIWGSINLDSIISGSSGLPDISINADKVIVTGVSPGLRHFTSAGYPSMIIIRTNTPKPDQNGKITGGNISIKTGELTLTDGGLIRRLIRNYSEGDITGSKIDIKVSGVLTLSGVNNHGEMVEGFGSGIYSFITDSQNGAGPDIDIQANSLRIDNGAIIESRSENSVAVAAGNIHLQIHETAEISGDSTTIDLKEPLRTQIIYLDTYFPVRHNQSVSGIYTRSENQGKLETLGGGQITLSAKNLILTDRGTIATDSGNENRAGQIEITVERLEMDRSAAISSSSRLANIYDNEVAEPDGGLLVNGDLLEVKNIEPGKSGRFVYVNGQLMRAPSVYTLADESALPGLAAQYDLIAGDIAEFRNEQTGERFWYIHLETWGQVSKKWVRMDDDVSMVLNDMFELNAFQGFPDEALFHDRQLHDGQLIQVNDTGKGNPGIFVYSTDPRQPGLSGMATRLNNFTFANLNELQKFTGQYDLQNGDIATVSDAGSGVSERLVYVNNDWLKSGLIHTVDDMTATRSLIKGQPGFIAQQTIAGQSRPVIHTGREWIPLNNTYRVNTLAERDQLPVQHGDLVKVADIGNGRHDAFVYANGEWITQTRGGDAGKITIKADTITLTGDSQIGTESISGGGGSVTFNVDNLMYLTNSEVSTSVQEGVGHGGDLTITEPQFIIMNNGQIIAQANEGNGGDIRLTSEQFLASPKSIVSASSKLGIDGRVNIEAPDENMSDHLALLPDDRLDAEEMMKKPCSPLTNKERSHFYVNSLKGVRPAPHDRQGSGILPAPTSCQMSTPLPLEQD